MGWIGLTTVNVTRGIGIELHYGDPDALGAARRPSLRVYDPKTGLVDVAGGARVPNAALRDAIERDAGLRVTGRSGVRR